MSDVADRLDSIRERVKAATEGPWEETWKWVPGYEGRYEVSDMGRVRSHLRPGNHNHKKLDDPRIMSGGTNRGYRTVAFTDEEGHVATKRVHRLVLQTFVGPCPEGHEASHLNGDRSDNRLENLKWETHKENEARKEEHGTLPDGATNGMTSLVGWQVAEIKYLVGRGLPQTKVADLFGVSRDSVHDIATEKTWTHVEAREDVPFLLSLVERYQKALLDWDQDVCWCGHPRIDHAAHDASPRCFIDGCDCEGYAALRDAAQEGAE